MKGTRQAPQVWRLTASSSVSLTPLLSAASATSASRSSTPVAYPTRRWTYWRVRSTTFGVRRQPCAAELCSRTLP